MALLISRTLFQNSSHECGNSQVADLNAGIVVEMKSIFLLLPILFVNALSENLDKFFSDNVQFEFSYYGGEEWDKSADLSHQITNIYTPDDENYKCVLPQIELNAS